MKSKRELARSSRAMTNGAFTAMTGRSSFQRMIQGLAALLMALALVFGFASCKTESEEETVYRTVTYSTEHATAPEKLTVANGTALTAEQLPALTESGYTFGGWYDGETKAETGYRVTKNVTLTAKWTVNSVTPTPDDGEDDGGDTGEITKYTVTFNTNGGTTVAAQKIESGKTATEPTAPTKDGYIFGGWFTDSNFATAFTFSTAIKSDITLYAKWTLITYTVTFNTNGGTEVASQKIESGKTATEPTAPTKDGYTFGGWFTDSNFATAFTFSTAITADITLYAKWIEASKPTYTVTFSTNGAETKQTVAEGEKVSKPTDPTKTGYTFDGWYKDDTKFDFETTVTANLTLTAKWTLTTYTITYEGLNGAANPNTATSYTVESETITLQNPTRTGYTFTGWYDAETGGNKVESIAKGSTEAKTLYAQWTAISYEITYVLPNGVTNPNVTSYTIESNTITLQSPARTGYTFNGWYDAETGGNKIESIAQGSTGAKTLYAQWMLITYTITYEGLNGVENPNTITSYTVESETITLQNPARAYYTFDGWFDAETGGNKVESIAKGSTEAKTLYAQWTAINYEITYVLPNGVTNPNVRSYTIESNTITLQSLAKTGYTFNGWFDAETGGNKVESIAQGSTGAKTFYAQWTLITYTITYNVPDGTDNPNTVTSYTVESETITLQNPTRTGYTFTGWYDAETGGNKVESIAKGSTEAKTLYAQWTAISYEITYVLPNGVTNPNVTSYTVETETITLQDFSHDNYTFEGWFDAETGGNKVTSIPKGSTGNKTLYAHCTWKWIGTKNPTTAKSVGDIVFSDGSATAYSTDLTLSDAQKEAAVAVIYYAGSSAEDVLGAKTLGVGLKNTKGETTTTLQWARYTSSDDKAEGYSTNITAIQCTSSEMGSGKAATATFTGDTDGSDNWQALCAAVSDEGTSGNYPAWEWVNAYATPATANLTGSYANGWYLPTVAELSMLYRAKDTVNSALEKAGGTKIADTGYWSSSQYASIDYYAWGVWFDDGYLYYGYKDNHKSVCTVRAF